MGFGDPVQKDQEVGRGGAQGGVKGSRRTGGALAYPMWGFRGCRSAVVISIYHDRNHVHI